MLEPNEKELLEKGLRPIRIIWVAALGSLVVYIIMVHLLGEKINLRVSDIGLYRNIALGLTIAELWFTYFIRKKMLLSKSPRKRTAVLHYMEIFIITLEILESIAIYGLLLIFLGDSLLIFYIFIAISALAMVYFRPKWMELEQIALAMKQTS